MRTRREFLSASIAGGACLALSPSILSSSFLKDPFSALSTPLLEPGKDETLVTILHTNDVNSQIDSLHSNQRNAGKGRILLTAPRVKRIRSANPYTLMV